MEIYCVIASHRVYSLQLKVAEGLTKKQAEKYIDTQKRKDIEQCNTGWKYRMVKTADDSDQIRMDI